MLFCKKKISLLLITSTLVIPTSYFNFSCAINAKNAQLLEQSICITALEDNTTIKLELNGNYQPNLQFTYFGKWEKYMYDEPFSINKNQILYLRGLNESGWSKSKDEYVKFIIDKPVDLTGNLKNLINYNLDSTTNCPLTPYCFYKLFDSCKISNLSVDFLSSFHVMEDHCFSRMFNNSTISNDIPRLDAITATYCYEQMFANCQNLEKITSSITTNTKNFSNHSCERMFYRCEKLINVPKINFNQIDKYGESCFQEMFYKCKNLTTPFENIKLDARFTKQFNKKECNKCFFQTFTDCKSLFVSKGKDNKYRNINLITIPKDINLTSNNPFSHMFSGCNTLNFNNSSQEVETGETYYCCLKI